MLRRKIYQHIQLIRALGNISRFGKNDFILIRYHPDGSLDEDFGENGKIITELSNQTATVLKSHDTASGLTMQTDGKIIVTGGTAPRIGTDQQFVSLNTFRLCQMITMALLCLK